MVIFDSRSYLEVILVVLCNTESVQWWSYLTGGLIFQVVLSTDFTIHVSNDIIAVCVGVSLDRCVVCHQEGMRIQARTDSTTLLVI